MNNGTQIIEDMKTLGFSEYEAKAYLKLLEEYPVNGYTVSKNSGIPRSRIYEVLESLKDKQIVFEQKKEKSTLYHPLDPKLLVKKFKKHFNEVLDNLNDYTKRIYLEEQSDNRLIVIKGRKKIMDFLSMLIVDSKKRIVLSIWEEEINDISDVLDEAIDRGVMVKGIYFGKNNRYKELAPHRRIERYLSEKKERYITAIIDGVHVVSGVVSRGENSQVTWTKDAGFIEMSEDYIAHDLMVNLYSQKLSNDEKEKYEKFLDNVRKEYFGFTEEEFKNFNK
ncbi:MAG: HTH-type transcriptional regulator, sugar sensing transcriptional regulator [Candidatus Petromonas sp.]|jgi:sugar-specific transcriptional regulator TrmB|nr:HTH-type transcriptional regulator, sugar sensing transcriptional regulator [Candidatus Petromonas sp.]